MNSGQTVFRQLLQYLPRHEFNVCVRRYRGEYWAKTFSTFDQFLCLAYAQLSGRDSLRDIETCLNSHRDKLYHVGFRGTVSRTTLADSNERRDWRIFQDFGHILVDIAQRLYQNEPLAIELKQPLFAFDSTTIDLCLTLFPWAEFRKTKAAVKMHTLIDLRGSIPTFVAVTVGKMHDVRTPSDGRDGRAQGVECDARTGDIAEWGGTMPKWDRGAGWMSKRDQGTGVRRISTYRINLIFGATFSTQVFSGQHCPVNIMVTSKKQSALSLEP